MRTIANWQCIVLSSLVALAAVAEAQQRIGPGAGPQIQRGPTEIPADAPQLELEQTQWDFGEVWYGEPLKKEIKLTNAGKSTLRITNVRKSCGCTLAEVEKDTLEPGESTVFKVGYDSTKGRVNVRQTVNIYSNDPRFQPAFQFVITGTCKDLFNFEPTTNVLSFGQVGAREVSEKTLKIENVWQQPIKLELDEERPVPGFDVHLKEIEPGQRYELIARTEKGLGDGPVARVVYLKTNVEFLPHLRVRLMARVVPPVTARPNRILVARRAQFQSTKPLEIGFDQKDPVKIEEITCDAPDVTWDIVEENGARGSMGYHRLAVKVPPGSEIPAKGYTLTIKTDLEDDEYGVIEVPIIAWPPANAQVQRRAAPPTPRVQRPAPGAGANVWQPQKDVEDPFEKD